MDNIQTFRKKYDRFVKIVNRLLLKSNDDDDLNLLSSIKKTEMKSSNFLR